MTSGLALDDLLKCRTDLGPDQIQILAHENTAVLDPYFNESAFITLAGSARAEVVSYRLPAGMLGILRAVAMQTSDPNDQNSIIWQVLMNGSPVLGLDNIIGIMSTFLFPLNVDVAMYDGYVVSIVAINQTVNPISNVWGMVRGNFFGRSQRP